MWDPMALVVKSKERNLVEEGTKAHERMDERGATMDLSMEASSSTRVRARHAKEMATGKRSN